MVIVSPAMVPAGFDGVTVWPFIFVCFRDEQLLAHEMVHYKEMAWKTPYWWARYAFDRKFRVDSEVRAYKAEIKAGMPAETAAMWLMKYDDRLTEAAARFLLTEVDVVLE
jgi:hypothetical protein